MFGTWGDGGTDPRSAPHCACADGETFEIRYVDAAEASVWASERGFLFGQDDLSTTVTAYLD